MTYNEIDKLAQDAASKLDKGADLGTVYAYHALREVYELYRCGKKPREQAERDRRLIAHAYRRWEQDMERHFALCRERNEQLLRAGTVGADEGAGAPPGGGAAGYRLRLYQRHGGRGDAGPPLPSDLWRYG